MFIVVKVSFPDDIKPMIFQGNRQTVKQGRHVVEAHGEK